jgi:hypothetical protein
MSLNIQSVTALTLVAPSTRTATVTGTGVDLAPYVNTVNTNLKIVADVGTVTGTTPTLDIKIQDSDDNSSFSDITGATFTQITATGAGAVEIHTKTNKRYIRAVGTIAGTTPSFPLAIWALVIERYT